MTQDGNSNLRPVETSDAPEQPAAALPQVPEPAPKPAPGPKGPGKGAPPGPKQELKRLRKQMQEDKAEIARLTAQAEALSTAHPVARPAGMRRRHWGLLVSFAALVVVPLLAAVFYLFTIAEDQYVSTTGFIVRSQESTSSTDLLGGIATLTGNGTASDGDILFEFIQSQEMVSAVDADLNLRGHYSAYWPKDWIFALWPSATQEDLAWYWQRIVGISYDSGSGLTEVQISAFDAETAQAIARSIVRISQERINALNEQARSDAMRYARADLDVALERLKEAREALIAFRTRTRIVDPEADIQGRMGVMNNLQQQLAEALIEYDLQSGTLAAGDPRLGTARRRIDVIRDRIEIERINFASADNTETGAIGEDYPRLISEFERLNVNRQFAEESYGAALAALEVARDAATRQGRYLATYINPTLAEVSQAPRRFVLTGLVGLFLLLGWSILALIYYSIRDRS
ncbi:sugar transporter [Epibacterium ulvae]|uniref:sugar transporter n=1 Tax=Epibacterium ulvae TaxID=1156985 RepID=UPI0024920B83|nr:sugar transporter [Epibacterium ulvae]